MSKAPTHTVQLMHANKRIAELEALYAQAESARMALAMKLIPAGPTPARLAYLAQRAIKTVAEPSEWQIKCLAAKAAAMATGKVVRV